MRIIGRGCLFVLFLLPAAACSADQPNSVSVFGTFSSSSELFHHPDDSDPTLRSQFLPINDIFSIGFDYRRVIDPLRLRLIVSIEYISGSQNLSLPLTDVSVPEKDGYSVIPLEVSGSFNIPVGTDILHFYIGGGGGMYIGERIYEVGGIASQITGRKPGFGIQILSGLELNVSENISLRSEVKFRDVQFESENRFPVSSIKAGNGTINLDTQPFNSRISIDGTTLHLGVVVSF